MGQQFPFRRGAMVEGADGRSPTERPGGLTEFYEERHLCFLNTKKGLKHIWHAFELLDVIWHRELDDLSILTSSDRIVPVSLFHDAGLKIRLVVELGFSRCLPEACDLLRGAIESAAYGRFLTGEPHLASIWMGRNIDDQHRKEFMKHFVWGATPQEKKEKNDKKGLVVFAKGYGLNRLRPLWKRYSEYGAHTTSRGVTTRIKVNSSAGARRIEFRYLDPPRELVEAVLSEALVCCRVLEDVFYSAFESRLSLDHDIERLRKNMMAAVSRVVSELRNRHTAVL
jgi:hypothetical protein